MPITKVKRSESVPAKAPVLSSSAMVSPVVVRMGVVGCGYWGPNLIRNFNDLQQSRVETLCDIRESQFRPFAKKYPWIRFTTSYEDILKDPSIDAVAIATPVSTHYRLARKALEAGKHVLVEKPMTGKAQDAVRLAQLAKSCNKILMVGHTFEYHPAVLKIAKLLKSGELGDLHYIDSVRVNLGLHQSDGLNVIWDLAPHDISIILHWIQEMPLWVSAWGRSFVHSGIEDVAFVRLEFPRGILAHLHLSWLAPSKIRRITVAGNKKMIIYDDLENVEKLKVADRGVFKDSADPQLRVAYRMGDIVSPKVEVTEPLSLACAHFIDCILTGRKPLTDGESGTRVVRILEAAHRSIKRGGRKVTL